MSEGRDRGAALSIGAVSRATGISSDTLRTWERRYGFPSPARTKGGHRLYALETVEMLRLINDALDQGHRPSQVVGASRETLEELLMASHSSSVTQPLAPELSRRWDNGDQLRSPGEQVHAWLSAARRFDAQELEQSFRRAWYTLGALTFLEQYASRFVREIGEAWSDGRIEVAHEHFASERLRDFLTSQWRPLSDRAQGPSVICANLPEERHNLGLHMVAVVMATSGFRVLFLGSDTPTDGIARVVERMDDVVAVLISVSRASNPLTTRRALTRLRERLDAGCQLLAGGGGAPHNVEGVRSMDNLRELGRWAPSLFMEHRASSIP